MGKTSVSSLPGTWKLISVWYREADGSMTFPFGDRPTGMLFYDAFGNFAGQIARAGRDSFATGAAEKATREELAAALGSYAAEFGQYDIEPDRIVHHIVSSIVPNQSATDRTLFYRISGTRLTHTTPALPLDGIEVTTVLVWERIT